ncbi:MAG: hypothetical protein MJZ07_04645 [Bacteroidales bacterium]|nr:hypothetical protein [Bacteroidales bacterium]
MMDNSIENKKFDCSRGCTVERNDQGEAECNYRQGCCKLEVYDWLKGVGQEQYKDLFEVRFKNTRKGIYVNASGQTVKTGDIVIVEANTGHDVGIVTLEGPVVGHQMKTKRIAPDSPDIRKIYRKAKLFDIEKWQEAIGREHEVMIRSRQIAAELGLEMKIGDVEFQGDGTKAIFYYIADGRVDFRQLIKVFAEEFRIRIEMKQIGARQEAGLIGGLGVCGRELCCSNYISTFQSITTSAARIQDLSLNPQKLAGQCGKLKCCLNYETAVYLDAQTRIPKVSQPLEFQDGQAFLMKTDILKEVMYFSYDKGSLANLYPLEAWEVREIIMMNRNGQKPESLQKDVAPAAPEFVSAVGDDSITRFDEARKKKKNNHRRKGRGGNNRGGDNGPRKA